MRHASFDRVGVAYLCSCQKQVQDNMQELVEKMVGAEGVDMCGIQSPEVDMDDHYYTAVAITLFQMVDQNVRERKGKCWGGGGGGGGGR